MKDENSFYVHGKRVMFAKNSLGMLPNRSPVRVAIVWLTTWVWFDRLIITLIMANSMLLGAKDYQDPLNETPINQFVESCEPLFVWAFLIECVLKIFAMGFFLDKHAYLTDAWNWLDFIVVASSLLTKIPGMENASGLRTFRLFRPLRSLNTLPQMKILVGTLLSSIKKLGGIMGLGFFFFSIFAILGISQWSGLLHYRCR